MIRAVLVGMLIALIGMPTTAQADAKPGDTGQDVVEIQYVLRSHGYVLAVDGVFGRQTAKAVRHFQRANGLLPDAIVGPLTEKVLFAEATKPAVRVDPASGLSGCELMMFYARKHGLPDDFLALGKRESNCTNDAANACCYGFWQNYFSSHMRSPGYLPGIRSCGIDSLDDIYGNNPRAMDGQACMTAVLYRYHAEHGPHPLWPWRL